MRENVMNLCDVYDDRPDYGGRTDRQVLGTVRVWVPI